jgi:glycosyltransferase involved in cell wall biosynthesis
VLPSRNEGDYLLRTIESAYKAGVDEIVVVDDASADASAHYTKLPGDVILIRHNTPKGVAKSRNIGLAVTSGDTIILADAHTEFKGKDSLRSFGNLSLEHDAILCATCSPMDQPYNWKSYGAWLSFRKKSACYYHPIYRKETEGRLRKVNCLFGATYAMNRRVYRRLNGWLNTEIYGYNEQSLSLSAFFKGIPLLVDQKTHTLHLIKKKINNKVNYDVPDYAPILNRFIVHHTVFEEDTFEEYMLPLMRKASPEVYTLWDSDYKNKPELMKQKDMWQQTKIMTDEEFFAQLVNEPKEDEYYPDRERDSK